MDLFEQRWQTYRSVIENDWMEHRGVTAACSSALQAWMAQHPERHRQARLLDGLRRHGPDGSGLPRALPLAPSSASI